MKVVSSKKSSRIFSLLIVTSTNLHSTLQVSNTFYKSSHDTIKSGNRLNVESSRSEINILLILRSLRPAAYLEQLNSYNCKQELQENSYNDDITDRLHRHNQTLDNLLQPLSSTNLQINYQKFKNKSF